MSKLVSSRLPCPKCPSSDAYHKWSDGHGYCFSCKSYFKDGHVVPEDTYTYEYLPWRGVTAHSFERYGVKTKIAPNGEPISLGYPYSNGSFKVRNLLRKDYYSLKSSGGEEIGKAGLFGQDKFEAGKHKFVTITEGELDALSLHQVLGGYPVVSVQSAATAKRDCTVAFEWLDRFDRIYLAFDNDAAGREALRSVASLFDYAKVYVVKYGLYKDANEYLEAGQEQQLKELWWSSRKYLPETIISSFSDFNKILLETTQHGVSYPWPTLDAMTYGIRTGESVLLTAQEGVGKTELMHSIEYHLLKRTQDNVGAIYLEEPKRRHLESLAGLELGCPAHLPDSGLSRLDISNAAQKAIGKDDRLHLYSHFGSDDPAVLIDTIRFLVSARSVRYVLLDHISMVVSGLAGDDERRALDYIATRLEMMVQELDFALIIVSHVNDFGQTRGSRYIAKIAHIRIDAVRDLTHPDVDTRNTTYLTVSKNRFCGRTGPAGRLVFNPQTYSYTEMEDERSRYHGSPPTVPHMDHSGYTEGATMDRTEHDQVLL